MVFFYLFYPFPVFEKVSISQSSLNLTRFSAWFTWIYSPRISSRASINCRFQHNKCPCVCDIPSIRQDWIVNDACVGSCNQCHMGTNMITTILTVKNPKRCNSVSKMLLFLTLNEAQHVSGDTPPIIRSLKLHKQPLVLHTWKVVGCAVLGRCWVAYTLPDSVQE